jgi:hypothetical protein
VAARPPSIPRQDVAPIATSLPFFAGTTLTQDFMLGELARAEPKSFKPVGSTSTVFRMRLSSTIDAAWKAASLDRPRGPTNEVAAYRLARCLGLDNVPPAISRAIPFARIHALLAPQAAPHWNEISGSLGAHEDSIVEGAAIYWIPELVDVGVDLRSGLRRASTWLAIDGVLPDAQRGLGASLSTMLGFDYLIGNRDRWSGHNVSGDPAATTVYIRDHDLAFPSQLTASAERQLFDDTRVAQRFSRSFYAGLQALTRARLQQEFAQDPVGAQRPLLNERQLQGVVERRQALLTYIDALIAQHGNAAVLVFP